MTLLSSGHKQKKLGDYFVLYFLQERRCTTVSVEVKKSQHKYVIGPRGSGLSEILDSTDVSVEVPPLDRYVFRCT